MNIVYYTKSNQEYKALSAWLLNRGYLSWLANYPSHDLIEINPITKKFYFAGGQYQLKVGHAVIIPDTLYILVEEIVPNGEQP